MAAKAIVLDEDEEWEEADDTAWKDRSRLLRMHQPARQRRGRVTFQGEEAKEPDERQHQEEQDDEEDGKETRQGWHEEDTHEDDEGGIEDEGEGVDPTEEGGLIPDGKQEDEDESNAEEAGDEEYDGEADDNDWQEDEEDEQDEEEEYEDEEQEEEEQQQQEEEEEDDKVRKEAQEANGEEKGEQENEEEELQREDEEDKHMGEKKQGDKNKSSFPHTALPVQEKRNSWPSPVEADAGPRRWVSEPRVNASRNEGTSERPTRAGSLQAILRSTGNSQGTTKSSAGVSTGVARLQEEVERLGKENWALRLEIGQERYRVQQLEALKEQAAQARQRELEARRAQAIAVHELEQAQGSADRRDEFTKSERAQLLRHIEELERSTQEVLDRDSALRLQLQEALADRAGAKEKEDAAARELARWKKEALDHAAKLKLAEQRLQQLEQKHTEDKAKIKALTTQLRSCAAATAESADDREPSKRIPPGDKDIGLVKPRRKSDSPVKRSSGRQPQQGSGRGTANLNGKEHRKGAANDWVSIGGQVCAGMACTTSGIASRARMVTGGIVRWAWQSLQRFTDPSLVDSGVPGVAIRGVSKGGRGSTSGSRKRVHIAALQETEHLGGTAPEAFKHVKAGGTDEALAVAKQMQVLGVLVILIIGMAVVKLLV